MAIMLLTSASGAPGVTTTALALALSWRRDVLLVDCDRDVSQSVQAGWLGAQTLSSRGLVELAQAHREMRPLAPLVWDRSVLLARDAAMPAGRGVVGPAPESTVARRFLPGFGNPGAVDVFEPVWAEFCEALAGLATSGVDVIVDAGRITHQGIPAPLLGVSDVVMVAVRSSLRSLAAARLSLPGLRERTASVAPGTRVGLLVVGPTRPYPDHEVERQFGMPVLADLAWNPQDAAVLSDGGGEPKHFRERPFMRSAMAAASGLAARLPMPTVPQRVQVASAQTASVQSEVPGRGPAVPAAVDVLPNSAQPGLLPLNTPAQAATMRAAQQQAAQQQFAQPQVGLPKAAMPRPMMPQVPWGQCHG
jgi:hypothetical protein